MREMNKKWKEYVDENKFLMLFLNDDYLQNELEQMFIEDYSALNLMGRNQTIYGKGIDTNIKITKRTFNNMVSVDLYPKGTEYCLLTNQNAKRYIFLVERNAMIYKFFDMFFKEYA